MTLTRLLSRGEQSNSLGSTRLKVIVAHVDEKDFHRHGVSRVVACLNPKLDSRSLPL